MLSRMYVLHTVQASLTPHRHLTAILCVPAIGIEYRDDHTSSLILLRRTQVFGCLSANFAGNSARARGDASSFFHGQQKLTAHNLITLVTLFLSCRKSFRLGMTGLI